jgi:transcriptional regulator with XRE-family HTH domain
MDFTGFNKEVFAELLNIAKGKRSINKYGLDSEVDPGYISRLMRGLIKTPPSAVVINKLAAKAHNNVTVEKLMVAAGYITKEELFKTAINAGYLEHYTTSELFNEEERSAIRLLLDDPDHVFNKISPEAKSEFFKILFYDTDSNDFWNKMIHLALEKRGVDSEKMQEVVFELENLTDQDVSDVIDFIRYKKSKSKEK